jgi:hypothetical protein
VTDIGHANSSYVPFQITSHMTLAHTSTKTIYSSTLTSIDVPICDADMDLQDINLRMVESCPEETTLQNLRSRTIEMSFTLGCIIFWANFSVNCRVTTNKFCNRQRQRTYIVPISRSFYTNPVKRTNLSISVITQFAGVVSLSLQSIPYPVGMLYVRRASGSMGKKLAEPWWRSISVPSNRIN